MHLRPIIIGFFLLFGIHSHSQTDTGKENFTKMLKVKNNIYMLQSDGGNIGMSFGKDGIFMVDDQFTEDIEELQKEIKKIGDKEVRFVVNTHFHNDHTAGNTMMAKAGAVIFSQEMVRTRLVNTSNDGKKKLSDDVLPMITFKEELNFYFNNEKIEVFHLPNAHTDGDAMVYFSGSNVLQTGDLFFNLEFPFIDLNNGGSVEGYIKGIQIALSRINTETKIIPGHGPLATYKDFAENLRLLDVLFKKVKQFALLGKTEDEVANMKELTDEYKAKGYSPRFVDTDSFIRTLYKEATQSKEDKELRKKENEEAKRKYDEIKKKQGSKKLKNN